MDDAPAPQSPSFSAKRLIPVGVLVLGLVAFFAFDLGRFLSFDTLRQNRAALLGWVDTYGIIVAALAYMLIYTVAIAFSLPGGAVLTITGGFLFGSLWGTVCVVFAATAGATALFLIAKTSFGDALRARAGPALQNMQAGFQEGALSYLLVLRLVPLFPFFLVNLVPAFLGVSLRVYVLGTFIGIIPGTFVFATVGAGLGSVFDQGEAFSAAGILTPQIITALVGLAVLALIPVGYKKLKARCRNKPDADAGTTGDAKMAPESAHRPAAAAVEVLPADEHNLRLLANTHPTDYENPTPNNPYNLVVLGAGTAGLVSAIGSAGLGARVALIEKHLMGGDCLNYGCVPSKGIIRAASAWAEVRDAPHYGVQPNGAATVDFGAVMARMRRLRAQISRNDSVQRYTEAGVDVFLGEGRFVNTREIEVGGQTLRFAKAVIATGGRAAAPPVAGLAEAGYLTNETVFSLTERPARLAVIGGGPIGCELAQTFCRLGSRVTLLHTGDHVLNREDADAAHVVQASMLRDGVELALSASLFAVEVQGADKVLRYKDGSGNDREVAVDAIIVAAGRTANVDALGLEAAGVACTPRGVQVDDTLRTSNPRIFAAGDVCSRFQFTHAADFMARIVIANALFKGRQKASALTIPWCTYTEPQIAHVGLTEVTAAAAGTAIDTFTQPFDDVDRAILDGDAEGFAKVHIKKGGDTILGATIVARNAGDMIGIYATAMTHGLGLGKLSKVILPYPTQAEAVRKTGDLYNRTRLTPTVRKIMGKWLRWQRGR